MAETNEKIKLLKKYIKKYLEIERKSKLDFEKQVEKFSNNVFANKIQKKFKIKLDLIKVNKEIRDVLCNDLPPSKNPYRFKIHQLLELYNKPNYNCKNRLLYLYFYYCKFGNKDLGYSEGGEIGPELINEVVDCLFFNVSFASTRFNKTTFKLVKFINANRDEKIYKELMKRPDTLKALKKNPDMHGGTLLLKNIHLDDAFFEECYFYNVDFDSLKLSSHDKIATRFLNCTYRKGTTFFPQKSELYVDYQRLLPSEKKDHYLLTINTPLTITKIDNGIIEYEESKKQIKPKIIYDKCLFINHDFILRQLQAREEKIQDSTLFIECTFNGSTFNNLTLQTCIFKKCSFIDVIFDKCIFIDCLFKECLFDKVKFLNCELGNFGANELDDCEFNLTHFIGGCFHNYINQERTTIIRESCTFNSCIFSQVILINFKFNYDSKHNIESNQLKLTKCRFTSTDFYGVNFDNCDLEATNFAETRLRPNEFNWFGNIFYVGSPTKRIYHTTTLYRDKDKTTIFKDIFDNGDGSFDKEFNSINMGIKFSRTSMSSILKITKEEYQRYNKIIHLEELLTKFKPYDYFKISDGSRLEILPSVSMFNTTIKTCNFQSATGLEEFDFSQVKDRNLTSTDFTNVNLTNTKMINCTLIGTIFQIADINNIDFTGSVFNNNTDFTNTLNIEYVKNRKERQYEGALREGNGIFYIENTINQDIIRETERELEFGAIQGQANETHARSSIIINNRNKLHDFYEKYTCGSLSDPKNLNNFKLDIHLVPITIFFNKLLEIVNKLKRNEQLSSIDKDYLLNNFSNSISNFVSSRLKYKETEKNALKTNLDRCITRDFISILTSIKRPIPGGEPGNWSWLGMVYGSLIYLFSSTKLYLKIFIEYYFNEVFNAHGPGSQSCVLGMVERWITIHSQATEAYLMTLVMENSEMIPKRINLIKKLSANVDDDQINKEFLQNFNNIEEFKEVKSSDDKEIIEKLIENLDNIGSIITEIIDTGTGYYFEKNDDEENDDEENDDEENDDEENDDYEIYNKLIKLQEEIKKRKDHISQDPKFDRKEHLKGTITLIVDNLDAILFSLFDAEGDEAASSAKLEALDNIEKLLDDSKLIVENLNSIITPPTILDLNSVNNKYVCHKLINLLKPNSSLPETPEDSFVVEFDYNITPVMRDNWHESCKSKFENGKFKCLDDICNDFVKSITGMILEAHKITEHQVKELFKDKDKNAKIIDKIATLTLHLEEVEVPNLKIVILSLYDDDKTPMENLKAYFIEGGKRRKKTEKKGKGKSAVRKAKSLSDTLKKRSKSSLRTPKSDGDINSKNFENLLDRTCIKKFVYLEKENFNLLFNTRVVIENQMVGKIEYYDDIQEISFKNMNIMDKPYKELIKKQYTQVKEKYKLLISKREPRQLKILTERQRERSTIRPRGRPRGTLRGTLRGRTKSQKRTSKLLTVVE
jgi:uncharacterized protein YjbI with pentapeptide repeats